MTPRPIADHERAPERKPFYQIWHEVINAKCYEPKPRLCAGHYGYVRHRFPVKNGLNWREVFVLEQSLHKNPLFEMIRTKDKPDAHI